MLNLVDMLVTCFRVYVILLTFRKLKKSWLLETTVTHALRAMFLSVIMLSVIVIDIQGVRKRLYLFQKFFFGPLM